MQVRGLSGNLSNGTDRAAANVSLKNSRKRYAAAQTLPARDVTHVVSNGK